MKINKLKFLRNIIICVVALYIVSYILNMAPGFKRDKYKDITNIVIGDENLTEKLCNLILVSENGTVYLSKEDTENLLNSKIYYEEKYNTIITICGTKVAALSPNERVLYVNGSKIDILESAIEKNGVIYLPISEMTLIFNIEIKYINSTNIVIIDRLDKGIIKADVSKNTELKFKPRNISKTLGEVEQGEKVSCFYTTSKGWRLIRTENGYLRIC